ncbi:MAG: 50S ribosomal protein L3 [Tissierellia bacterium]|nr:50S ribosomal protein L3 [Tissierellia bacterium]
MKNMIGRKIGMTQIFEENGSVIPVSVVEAGPLVVVQKKTVEKDGYNAIQVGFENIKSNRANKPKKGHFEKANVEYKKFLREFLVEDVAEYEIGQVLKADVFAVGDMVDVTGTSKGKGTQGVIKRHGFARGPQSHGSKFNRRPGGLSAASSPGRVFKGHKMMGRMGNERVTVQNLEVVRVDADKNLILVRGAIPGPKKGLISIKTTTKN